MTIKELYKFALYEFSNAKIEDFHSEVDYIFNKYFSLRKIDMIIKGNENDKKGKWNWFRTLLF